MWGQRYRHDTEPSLRYKNSSAVDVKIIPSLLEQRPDCRQLVYCERGMPNFGGYGCELPVLLSNLKCRGHTLAEIGGH